MLQLVDAYFKESGMCKIRLKEDINLLENDFFNEIDTQQIKQLYKYLEESENLDENAVKEIK